MSVRIHSIERAENPVVQRQDELSIRNASSSNFDTIAIDVSRLVRAADYQRDWTAERFVRIPFKLARSNWLAFLAALRKEQTWMDRFRRRGMRVGDYHRGAFHCDAKEQFGKL